MSEIWIRIQDCPDYAVSDLGRVMRVTEGINTETGRILTAVENKGGYFRVCLQSGDKQVNRSVHRLVAQHHIPNPENKPQVNHKMGRRKWDNSASNLEWATRSENMRHADRTGLCDGNPLETSSVGRHGSICPCRLRKILPIGDKR